MHDPTTEQKQWLLQLKESRTKAFRSEVFPYFRYVASSGFGLLVSAALFFMVIQYIQWLNEFPADVPLGLYGAAIVALAAVWTPLRTYLLQADAVFLLPMEAAVHREYIWPLLKGAIRSVVLRTLAVYLLLVPLYIRAPHTLEAAANRPLWLLACVFAALGAWNVWGAWQERRIVHMQPRFLLRLARYIVTLVSAWAMLNAPLMQSLVFAVLAASLVTLLGRLPLQQLMPWEHLIREEARSRRRWFRFLGWFVDMPSEDWRPAKRKWAAWIGDRIPWGHQHVWRYLYAKTFIRSETLGAWLRWHCIIALIALVSSHPAADWTLLAIGVLMAGIQLSELNSFRFPLSVETMPLPGVAQKRSDAARVARVAGTASTVFLWLAAALPQVQPISAVSMAFLVAGMLWNVWLVPRRLAKRQDDED